jgi:hypothetical protein
LLKKDDENDKMMNVTSAALASCNKTLTKEEVWSGGAAGPE